MIITGVFISAAPLLLNDFTPLLKISLKSILFISYPFILFLFGFYEQAELQAISGFFKKWLRPGNISQNIRSLLNVQEDYSETGN
jgi:hypothetical protein